MFYKIIPSQRTRGKMFVSEEFAAKHVFVNLDCVTVSAGSKKDTVEVVTDSSINTNELVISKDIIESLSIPTNITYQVKCEKNIIKIGPVIGLLMANTSRGLTKGRLKRLLDYCIIYPEVHGLIVAFSVEDIDFDNQRVEGYFYNPASEDEEIPWDKGVFPFPDSIFERTGFSEEIRLRLKKETHNRMFNSNYFNKWEFWKMVSKFKPFLNCIPNTKKYTSFDDVDEMLSHYDSVYLKPIYGTLSRGIYRVTKEDDGYGFQGKQGAEMTVISSKEEAGKYIEEITSNHHYIIQQAIHPLKIDDRHLDFRVIMQKDHTLTWSCTGIVGFVGRRGDIVTNWGYTSTFEDTFTNHFNYSQQQIFKAKQEVIAACTSVCEMLDLRGGNYGDLGFDVIIDEKLRVWILEVNKRHYHTVPLWTNDVQTYYEVKAKPIKYAAALAGFEVY